jgi:acetyl-CoA carboxylase biotin carboxyl carrier protein
MSVATLPAQVGMCMGLTPDDLQELLAAFEQSSWQEMTVSVAGDTLHVSRRNGAAGAARPADVDPVPAAAPAPVLPPPAPPGAPQPDPAPVPGAGAVPAPAEASGIPVAAPSVGLFWRAPSPGAPPFVDVGTRVGPEDVVGIVEVMKLMNRVTAGISGVVTAVLVENGGMVEHGQPLVLIDPAA